MAAIVGVLMSRLSAGDESFLRSCYHRSREFCGQNISAQIRCRPPFKSRTGDFCRRGSRDYVENQDAVSESPTNRTSPASTRTSLRRSANASRNRNFRSTPLLATSVQPEADQYERTTMSCIRRPRYLGGHNDWLRDVDLWPTRVAQNPVRKLLGCLAACSSTAQSVPCRKRGLKTFALRMHGTTKTGSPSHGFLKPPASRIAFITPGLPCAPDA